MTKAFGKRSPLMLGCANTALALGLLLGPAPAAAQGIQADGQVVFGSGGIFNTGPNQTSIFLDAPVTVIDWTPQETAQGDALTFLPEGSTALFTSPQAQNFAVLNRILPSTNGNQVAIDGSVIGQVQSVSGGPTTGGFIAFYSPTGILIGSTATFDVGQLLLTTLDTTPDNFDFFVQQGGFLDLNGAAGSTARIEIQPGAQITATPDNAFFAVVAADVEMRGTARINGSHAYVAGEVVNLAYSNGLFTIAVPVGTADNGTVMLLDGNIGGPSSAGAGDNHMIYGVAVAQNDPISMLFRGNLGFDPAQTAGVINGEIILSANYNVSGRNVDGGSVSDGNNAVFNARSELTDVEANILIDDAAISSSLLAIGTHRTEMRAIFADSTVPGNLQLIGRRFASLTATGGRTLTINGDVLISASDYGSSSSGVQSLTELDAEAGQAGLAAFTGSTLTVNGDLLVTADAFAGGGNGVAGLSRGGFAIVESTGGTINLRGDATASARAVGSSFSNFTTGNPTIGGIAEFVVRQGGTIDIDQNLTIRADAVAANGSQFDTSIGFSARGGQAALEIRGSGGGTITVTGDATLSGGAIAGSSNNLFPDSAADAGEARVSIVGGGLIDVSGRLDLNAAAQAGSNAGAQGGLAQGGRAWIAVQDGGTVTLGGAFTARAGAEAGSGSSGGDAFGGIAGAVVRTGVIDIEGAVLAESSARGGNASFGFGRNGGQGRGGYSVLQADGTQAQTATLSVGGAAIVNANGEGGAGGDSDGQSVSAGLGGVGIGGESSVPNQADGNFGSGSYVQAGGDNGRITITGDLDVSATGTGGIGGDASGTFTGARGGDGFGGTAQIGLALLGQSGAVGLGTASFANARVLADGLGGRSGLSLFDVPDDIGGNGIGGTAVLSVRAGTVNGVTMTMQASGVGGEGAAAGTGTGGSTSLLASLGGSLDLDDLLLSATGLGGFAEDGTGGFAQGGNSEVLIEAASVVIDTDLTLDVSGQGGFSGNGAAGSGTGGIAAITTDAATGTATLTSGRNTRLLANGQGGDADGGFRGGNGLGGTAFIEALGGGTITLFSAQAVAAGRGGVGIEHEGGDGTGGTAQLRSLGLGSRLTIQRNTPNDFLPLLGAGAILSADGIGANNDGGNGVGGNGTGGNISLTASGGGNIILPADPVNDPNSIGEPIRLWARGLGGDSFGNGGVGAGGGGIGGGANILVDGATSGVALGQTDMSVRGLGGSAIDPQAADIDGGIGAGGSLGILIRNGGTATLVNFEGEADGTGGDGAGAGNGGDAFAGFVGTTVISGTLNIVSRLGQFSFADGGNGANGGNAASNGEGGGAFLLGEDATITFATNGGPDDGILLISEVFGGTGNVQGGTARGGGLRLILTDSTVTGAPGLTLDSETAGGNGATAGGNAQGAAINLIIDNTPIAGGALSAVFRVEGGSGTNDNGAGGNATGGGVQATFTDATVNLVGPTEFSAIAVGGDGGSGSDSRGGNATSGPVDVTLRRSSLTVAGVQTPGDTLRIASEATGGLGVDVGGTATSTGATLTLEASRVLAGEVSITATAVADRGRGALARGGDAAITISGASELTTDLISIFANGVTRESQASSGGSAALTIVSGSTATVTADGLLLSANASGADPTLQTNVAGRFAVDVQGGNLNLGRLAATALGDRVADNVPASQLVAAGGSINAADEVTATAFGDLAVFSGAGGIIGSAATAPTTTAVSFNAGGTIDVQGDGGTAGGIGGQSVAMQAGRSILIDSNISTRDGPVTLTANIGGGQAQAQPPISVVTMGPGGRINTGTGTVTIRLLDGAGNPQRVNGAINLARITGGRIDVRNLGTSTGSDIGVRADGVLTASGTGRAIDLASVSGEVINLAGDAGLVLTGGGHYGIFAATPTGSQIGTFANYARRYSVPDAASYDQLNPGGNFAAFRITPVLTINAADAARFYGSANPAFAASVTGFLPGDGPGDLIGAAQFGTAATVTSNIGAYTINVALGTLQSVQGYQIALGNPGVLTVTPRPITVTANNLSRIYGSGNPALSFSVGGQGLVNGDQLTGALVTAAGLTTGVGNVAITQGSLAASANYALTFAPGVLAITPRALTVAANNFTRVYGNANPALTFALGGDGLVNGDQLSGALATSAGLTTGVGTATITQGTLSAGGNYTINFTAGQLTITPRALTVAANNLSRIYGNANPALTFSVGGDGLVNGDQLSGALATTAGLTTGVGTAAITQGTLNGGGNYSIDFTGGQLTITPRAITVAANNLSRAYGNANPALTFSVGGDGLVNGDQLSGALATTAGQTTGVGTAAITQGTLAASANYTLSFAPGVLTITPRALTVAATNLSRVYGNANPALTFSIVGDGLINGDQLTGALATTAGQTTGVGNVAITQGTLAANANYALTFTPGVLAITPRPLALSADSLSKLLGLPDPALTFRVVGDGPINGDQITGGLVRDAGEAIGAFAIRQGTLSAGVNYAITFTGGVLTITPPPAPNEISSPILFKPPLIIGASPPPVLGAVDVRFGIDFPEQSDAPLIAEDPLLDEPVTSGGDASLYGTGETSPAGGQ